MSTTFGFTPAWFASGVVTAASAAEFAAYAATDPTKLARYWRWMAFRDYTEEHVPLTEAECRALFRLGESEADASLGSAMMCCVLYQSACPPDVRDEAARSTHPAVQRVVKIKHAV